MSIAKSSPEAGDTGAFTDSCTAPQWIRAEPPEVHDVLETTAVELLAALADASSKRGVVQR